MVKIKFVNVLFVLILGSCSSQLINENDNEGSVYVDVVIQRYLDLETALWQKIVPTSDPADLNVILQKIHIEHGKFYSRPFLALKGPVSGRLNLNETSLEKKILEVDTKVTVWRNYILQRTLNRSLDHDVIESSQFYANSRFLDEIDDISYEKDILSYTKEQVDAQNCSQKMFETTMESTADILMKLYETVAKSRLKAYTLRQISYMFLTVYNIERKISEASTLRKSFIEQSRLLQKRVRGLMVSANRDIWMCDMPLEFYDSEDNQITHLMDGYIDNEVNLNNDGDCTKSCSDYKVTKNYGCYKGTYCEQEEQSFAKCTGTIVDCQYIEPDFEICPAASYKQRRFQSIVYTSGRTLGNPNLCHQTQTKVSSWTRWFVRCSNCFCFCDEPGEKSDRYFSLQPTLSDTNQNKIITGVALRKVNRVFYWGITQATLLNNGQLNETRYYLSSWKRIKQFNITDKNVVEGIDYHTLSWQNRSINLDTLVAPPGYVLTGIRFDVVNGHLNLAIRITRFDFQSGRLFDSFEWISNNNEYRTPIQLNRPYESSHKSKTVSFPERSLNRYIEFQPTDIDKDGGQTTVPYIDVQLVQPLNERPTMLSGAGIYYKGSDSEPGFGGFIAPKIVTYDYYRHIG